MSSHCQGPLTFLTTQINISTACDVNNARSTPNLSTMWMKLWITIGPARPINEASSQHWPWAVHNSLQGRGKTQ